MASEQFSLCWDNFHKNLSAGMSALLENEDLVDVTLAVEGKHFKAHKMVLSVCSPYFKELFKSNPCKHPIVFMKDVSYVAMSDLLQFMYKGEVQVGQDTLTSFIKTAEALQIRGLTGDGNNAADLELDYPEIVDPQTFEAKESIYGSVSAKRPRLSSTASSTTEGLPSQILKDEKDVSADSRNLNPEEVQFKMEPYDQHQSSMTRQGESADETLDENFDETNIDEDYSMIEAPDVDSQVGTSMEGCTEGQDKHLEDGSILKQKHLRKRFISQGFLYHNNNISGEPPLRYLGCAETRKSGCRGRATIPVNGRNEQLQVTQPHNHPPDFSLEDKEEFLKNLRMALALPTMQRSSLKKVYETIAEIYLRCIHHKSSHCKGTAVIHKNIYVQNLRSHNHPPDQLMEKKIKFRKQLKIAAETLNGSALQIFNSVIALYPELEKTYAFNNVASTIRRHKLNAKNKFYN